MNWIKVTEQLPELDDPVLTFDGESICYAYRYKNKLTKKELEKYPHMEFKWREIGGCCYEDLYKKPTHWMVLPEKPK